MLSILLCAPSVVCLGRPDPFISLSLAEKLLLRASIPFPCPPAFSAFHAISGRGRKSHDAENINERRRRDYDARGRNDLQRARAAASSFLGQGSARVFTDSNRGGR